MRAMGGDNGVRASWSVSSTSSFAPSARQCSLRDPVSENAPNRMVLMGMPAEDHGGPPPNKVIECQCAKGYFAQCPAI
jgi:hypothetical protein